MTRPNGGDAGRRRRSHAACASARRKGAAPTRTSPRTSCRSTRSEQERLTDLLEGGGDASSRRGLDSERQRAETLRADQSAVESVMIPALMQLIQASMEEVGTLSLLLAPVIRPVAPT
jgi:hypothetical protein